MNDRHIKQTIWAKAFIRSLIQAGIKTAVVSPGYRNTALVSALIEQDSVKTFSVFDERAAAYLALGQARVTQQPSLLICTSGTAGAHYLPAIIEAKHSGLPLLIVTADRPLSLDQCGAPQTIDQINLYGQHVLGFFELGDPRDDENSLRAVTRKAVQAYEKTIFPIAGPVHINFRSEKPLELVQTRKELMHPAEVRTSRSVSQICDEDIREFIRTCNHSQKGLIVAGALPLLSQSLKEQILSFARVQGFALHAEATSQLRFSSPGDLTSPIIENLDLYLRDKDIRQKHRPDMIIQLGHAPVSKGVQLLLQECTDIPFWVISPERWNDVNSQATMLVRSTPKDFFEQVEEFKVVLSEKKPNTEWIQEHARLSSTYAERIRRSLQSEALTEGQITRALLASVPDCSTLFAANGLPVRHLDTFGPAHCVTLDILSQRGTSGIDGQIAGVLGAATVSEGPTTALIGDIGFLHDISALANAKLVQQPVVFVVINNAGGRIFEQLPIAKTGLSESNWQHWTTPQSFDLKQICSGYNVDVHSCTSLSQLVPALKMAYESTGVTVLDVKVEPDSFTKESQVLWGQ